MPLKNAKDLLCVKQMVLLSVTLLNIFPSRKINTQRLSLINAWQRPCWSIKQAPPSNLTNWSCHTTCTTLQAYWTKCNTKQHRHNALSQTFSHILSPLQVAGPLADPDPHFYKSQFRGYSATLHLPRAWLSASFISFQPQFLCAYRRSKVESNHFRARFALELICMKQKQSGRVYK